MTRTSTSPGPGNGVSMTSAWNALSGSPKRSGRMTCAYIRRGTSPRGGTSPISYSSPVIAAPYGQARMGAIQAASDDFPDLLSSNQSAAAEQPDRRGHQSQ